MPNSVPQVETDACIELTRELIAIPSASGEEQQVAAFLAGRLRGSTIDVTEVPPANLLATLEGGRPGPRRLFLTHLDTTSPGRMEQPYSPRLVDDERRGGRVLEGLGAAAPKGAVAAMVTALEAVASTRADLAGSVQLGIVTKDLWANHEGVRELTAAVPIDADWVVAGEPSGNRLVLGARGIAQVRIDVTGTPAHWGRPGDAANPLYGIADMLAALRRLALPAHAHLGQATVSPFEVTSEASPPQSPHAASLRVDRRILPDEAAGDVVDALGELARAESARTPGLAVEIEVERMMHAFAIDPAHALVDAIRQRAALGLGSAMDTTYISFSSNAGFTTAERGWPSVAFGPGEITSLGPNEHVPVTELTAAARAYAALMTLDWPPAGA